jgi:hypothetical protein
MDQDKQFSQTLPTSWRSAHDLTCTIVALILGLAIGWLDVHTTEVAVTILALLTAGLLLGLLQPVAAWRWALLMVIGIPTMAAVARVSGMQTPEPAQLDVRIVLVTLVFASLGCYAGVLIRRVARALTKR